MYVTTKNVSLLLLLLLKKIRDTGQPVLLILQKIRDSSGVKNQSAALNIGLGFLTLVSQSNLGPNMSKHALL